jgi:hypothetical protein
VGFLVFPSAEAQRGDADSDEQDRDKFSVHGNAQRAAGEVRRSG